DDEPWTAGFSLKYPGDNSKLESFQSYLVNNEALLEDKDGKRWAANGGSEVDQNQLTTRHFWVEDGKQKLGKPGDWKLVYRTPGRMSELPTNSDFKNLPLPGDPQWALPPSEWPRVAAFSGVPVGPPIHNPL